jgi:nucleotide-binding universal stress UspA family protein
MPNREWGLRSMAPSPCRAHPEPDDSEKATGKVVEAMSTIVVGVDHSTEATAALRFALEEAQFRGARVLAVHAIDPFSTYSSLAVDVTAAHEAADLLLEDATSDAKGEGDDVEIERRVVEGAPAAVLVEESRNADLLVVGSRGHGGFVGLLLGSVGQQCAHHAACPVVIVRRPSARSD